MTERKQERAGLDGLFLQVARIETTLADMRRELSAFTSMMHDSKTGYISREIIDLQIQKADRDHAEIWKAIDTIASTVAKLELHKEDDHKIIWKALDVSTARFWVFVSGVALALVGVVANIVLRK